MGFNGIEAQRLKLGVNVQFIEKEKPPWLTKVQITQFGNLYLSKEVKMKIIGTVRDYERHDIPLMHYSKDSPVYAFHREEHRLYLCARSKTDLYEKGVYLWSNCFYSRGDYLLVHNCFTSVSGLHFGT